LSRRHSREFAPLWREPIEERLRKYKARDLRNVEIKDAPDEDFKRILGGRREEEVIGGGWYSISTKEVFVNGYSPLGREGKITTLEHELAHHVFYTQIVPHKLIVHKGELRNYPLDESKANSWLHHYNRTRPELMKYVSNYAGKKYTEGFAESLAFMKKNPATTRRLMKEDKRLKEWFERIQEETGYKIRKTRED